jgi:hypothetical protein
MVFMLGVYEWEWFPNSRGTTVPNFTRYSKATFMFKKNNVTYVQPTTIREGVRSPLLLCFVVKVTTAYRQLSARHTATLVAGKAGL